MSLELVVTLQGDHLPTRSQWQAEIDSLSLAVQLDPELDLASHEGFSPTTLSGNASGFEICVLDCEEIAEDYPELVNRVAGVSKAICFTWGGDLAACACVMGAAAGLVKGWNSTAYYPADEMFYGDCKQLIDDYQNCLAEL